MSKRKSRVANGIEGIDWVRSYRSKLYSPKVWRLSAAQYRMWDMLLCMTDQNGNLPPILDIASHLRMHIPDAAKRVSELVELEFIDPIGDPRHQSHRMRDWDQMAGGK